MLCLKVIILSAQWTTVCKMTTSLWVLLLFCTYQSTWAGHVLFAPGNQYTYDYEGETNIKDVGTFKTHAQVNFNF